MEDNFHLTNKKGLLINLQDYYRRQNKSVFDSCVFPSTYLIKNGQEDEEYFKLKRFHESNSGSIWIVKPGENSNRGSGITLCSTMIEIDKQIEDI